MYAYVGCHDPVQKITGDAYHQCCSLGVSGFNPSNNSNLHIQYWTPEENERVQQLLSRGFGVTAISKRMKIEYHRVRAKVEYIRKKEREGLARWHYQYWTEDATDRVRELLEQGLSVMIISKLIKVSYHRVWARAEYIRKRGRYSVDQGKS